VLDVGRSQRKIRGSSGPARSRAAWRSRPTTARYNVHQTRSGGTSMWIDGANLFDPAGIIAVGHRSPPVARSRWTAQNSTSRIFRPTAWRHQHTTDIVNQDITGVGVKTAWSAVAGKSAARQGLRHASSWPNWSTNAKLVREKDAMTVARTRHRTRTQATTRSSRRINWPAQTDRFKSAVHARQRSCRRDNPVDQHRRWHFRTNLEAS